MASPAALSVVNPTFGSAAVGQDVVSHSSVLPKDGSKRKKVNRKLKQSKLDARREQWLSQVSPLKHRKESQQDSSASEEIDLGEIICPGDNAPHCRKSIQECVSERFAGVLSNSNLYLQLPRYCEDDDMNAVSTPSDSVSCLSDCFEMDNSPKSSTPGSTKYSEVKLLVTHEQIDIKQRSGTGNNPNDGTAGHTKHVSSHLDSPVKADECATESDFEDWEAAADALGVCVSHESVEVSGGSKDVVNESSLQPSFPESSQHRTCALSDAVPRRLNSRAWRPDDVHRPSSLPSIFNQQGQHLNVSGKIQQCMQPSQIALQDSMSGPVLCPICAEELDTTDSSFEPCICGFQLCLFCHHRIASEDGRCPGCRKCYNS